MPASFDDDEVTRLRVALGRTVRNLDRRTAEGDLTRTQLIVLGTILRHRRITLGDLAEYEGLHPTVISRCVAHLEKSRYIRRIPDEVDRRVTHAEVTAAGTRVWERYRRDRNKLLAELLDGLSARQLGALRSAIPVLEEIAEASHPVLSGGRRG